jgi:endonuclease YncB( thermonuclease family)
MENRDRADARRPNGRQRPAHVAPPQAASGGLVRERPSPLDRHGKTAWLLLAVVCAFLPAPARAAMPACHLFDRSAWKSCIYDGATGWEGGLQWRLAGFESPRIDAGSAGCHAEQIQGVKARDRLRALMARGYTITDTARRDREQVRLVRLMLRDGRNAGIELLSEGLVQAVPNTGNRWCGK